jgi:hypothetical protein
LALADGAAAPLQKDFGAAGKTPTRVLAQIGVEVKNGLVIELLVKQQQGEPVARRFTLRNLRMVLQNLFVFLPGLIVRI